MAGISVTYSYNNTTYSTSTSKFTGSIISVDTTVNNVSNVPLYRTSSDFVQCTETSSTLVPCVKLFIGEGHNPTYTLSSNSLTVSDEMATLYATDVANFVRNGSGFTYYSLSEYSPMFLEYTSLVTTPNNTLYFISDTAISTSNTYSQVSYTKFSVNSLGTISVATSISANSTYGSSSKADSVSSRRTIDNTSTDVGFSSSASDIYYISYYNVSSRVFIEETFSRLYEDWITSSSSNSVTLTERTVTNVDYRYLSKTTNVPLSSYTSSVTVTTALFSSNSYIIPAVLSGYKYSSYSYFTSSTIYGLASSSNLSTIQFTEVNSDLFTLSHTFSTSSVDIDTTYYTTSILPVWNMMLETVTGSEAVATSSETSSTTYPFDGRYSTRVVQLGFFDNLVKASYTLSSGYTSYTKSGDTMVDSTSELSTSLYNADTQYPSATSSSSELGYSVYSASTFLEKYYSTFDLALADQTISVTYSDSRNVVSTTSFSNTQTLYSLNSSVDGDFYTYETLYTVVYGNNDYVSTYKDVAIKDSFSSSTSYSVTSISTYNYYTAFSTYYSSLFSTHAGAVLTTVQLMSTSLKQKQYIYRTVSSSQSFTSQSSTADVSVVDNISTRSSVSLYSSSSTIEYYSTEFTATYTETLSDFMTSSSSYETANVNTNIGTIFRFSTIYDISVSSSLDLIQSISSVTSIFNDRVEQVWAYDTNAYTISTYKTTLTTSFSSHAASLPIFTSVYVFSSDGPAKTTSFTGLDGRFIFNKKMTSVYATLETVKSWKYDPEPEVSTVSTISRTTALKTSSAKSTVGALTSTADFTTISNTISTVLSTASSGRFINSSRFIISTFSEQQNDTLVFKTTYDRYSYYYYTNYSSTLKTIGNTISATTFNSLYTPNKFTTTVGETIRNSITSSYNKSTTDVNISSYTTTWMPIYYDVDGVYITA